MISFNMTAKFGRLPPIKDLGLGRLPQKRNEELSDTNSGESSLRFSNNNGTPRDTDVANSDLESQTERKESSSQLMILIENSKTKTGTKGSRKNGEKRFYRKKGQTDSEHHVVNNQNDSTRGSCSTDDENSRNFSRDNNFVVSDRKICGSNDFKQDSSAEWGNHKSVNRHESQLTEETTVDSSGNISQDASIDIIKTNKGSSKLGHVDFREMAIRLANDYSRPNTTTRRKRTFVDYVLVFDKGDESEFNENQRKQFESLLTTEGIEIYRTQIGNHVYAELCCSFERLCLEAESIFLEMPLIGLSLHHDNRKNTSRWRAFQSEKEVDDICIPFCNTTREIYDGIHNKNSFFRPGIRSLLVHQILKKIQPNEQDVAEQHNVEALAYLLHSDVYSDAFILHERSSLDPSHPLIPYRKDSIEYPMESEPKSIKDCRKDLHETWLSNFKFQPLWKIRNYFGEKIALYFAWLGMLITSLWIPTFIGLVVFLYGIIYAFATKNSNTWSRAAFDNDLTPGFALIICLWGTVFLELWKRKNAGLAYKWDVDDFEEQEPNRPQFYASEMQLNPMTGLYEPFYSPLKKTLKSMGSMVIIFFMVLLVVGSLVSVIIYRIIARVDWFSGTNAILLSNITSSVLNSTSIMLLGYLYKYLGKKLTEWENHRTQTQFEDSLILKLFGFQFVNSYSSLYYIAFFRENTKNGILGKGEKYTDSCGTSNDCMSLLSLQVGILMLMKPMPKFFSDVIVPLLMKMFRSIRHKVRRNKVLVEGSFVDENASADVAFEDYIQHERKKPNLNDFTLSEYTEKVLQYGYLMLFAAACPLAPLIALVTNLVDLRIDARRLLWLNRRPIPFRAQDIGMWYTILQLLNYIGIITNAFIIAISSSFGRKYKTTTVLNVVSNTTTLNGTVSMVDTKTVTVSTLEYLWIIILFQNISFIVRFILEYSIPDEPESVKLARKKERFVIEEVLKKAGFRRGRGKSIVPAVCQKLPSNQEQIVISGKKRGKKDSMKEKIRRISSKGGNHQNNQSMKWKNRRKGKLQGAYFKDDGNVIGQSEV